MTSTDVKTAAPEPQTPPAPPRKTLAAKLASIMGAIDRVAKSGYNEHHKYAFAREADVAEAVRSLLAAENVVITPAVGKYEVRENGRTSSGSPKWLAIVEVIFTVRDGDSAETIVLPWLGMGEDTGDKACYKAFTGAEKFLLLKLFLIPTGDEPEASDGEGRPTTKPLGSSRPNEAAPKVFIRDPTDTRPITEPQVNRLRAVMRNHNVDAKVFQTQVKARFGYASAAAIQRKDYDAIVEAAEAGGDFEAAP